ncbi:MAG TPA: hypothetical protein DCY20_10195 [Firmicutes bacterium]|nr:hypothetical protein [Bacillota bacterium]
MKKNDLKTNDTNHNDVDISSRGGGEKFFSIIMSVILLGIVVFYISLPIKALTYNDNKQPSTDQNNDLIVDSGAESDTDTQEPTQDEEETQVDDSEDTTTEEETVPEEEEETNDSTNSEQEYAKYALITYDGLNVRTDTTSNSEAIGKAPLNAKLPVLEEYTEYTWVKVLFNGQEGFVHTDFVEYVTE